MLQLKKRVLGAFALTNTLSIKEDLLRIVLTTQDRGTWSEDDLLLFLSLPNFQLLSKCD